MQSFREIGAGVIGKDEFIGLAMGGFGADDGGTIFHRG